MAIDGQGTKTKLLEVTNVSKSFPGVKAFSGISFDLFAGEVHCIVGENGAGKSTFIKILSGALRPDEGNITICGTQFAFVTPSIGQQLGIQTIYQETTLVPSLSVAENMFLGSEVTGSLSFVNFAQARAMTQECLNSLEIDIDPRELVENLGIAERQAVQIAKALLKRARILIMDEPTASFGRNEIMKLLDLVKQIRASGVGVIFISHHLDEVFMIADRITVLKDGIKVACHNAGEVTHDELIREMVGRDASLFYKKPSHGIGEVVLQVKNYSRRGVIDDASFDLHRGEILGVAGMVGSGRTELARLLFAADKRDSGEIYHQGKKITVDSPDDAIRAGICLIPEDRQRSGLILKRNIKDNIIIAGLNKLKGVLLNGGKEKAIADHFIKQLAIRTPGPNQLVQNLSGGNQQKVVLAKWLFVDADVFIFDEPTRGIDVGAKEEIYKIMTGLAQQGKAIMMISSDMPELIAMSDRIVVMNKGRITATLQKAEISEENILSRSIGGESAWPK
jgi:ABC-type sugar transport system ATPase subunit